MLVHDQVIDVKVMAACKRHDWPHAEDTEKFGATECSEEHVTCFTLVFDSSLERLEVQVVSELVHQGKRSDEVLFLEFSDR